MTTELGRESAPEWEPFLVGAESANALSIVDSVVDRLVRRGYQHLDPWSAAMEALLLLQHSIPNDARGLREAAESRLDFALDCLGTNTLGAGLYGGLSGVAWALENANAVHALGFDRELLDGVDDVLEATVSSTRLGGNYDLIGGLVGIGVYAHARRDRPSGLHLARSVLNKLVEMVEITSSGATWWTSNPLVAPRLREAFPSGAYNFGIAHGTAGIAALIASFLDTPIGDASVRGILEKTTDFLVASAPPGTVPLAWKNGSSVIPSARPAWCYGNPGGAAAIFQSGTVLGNSLYRDYSFRAALDAVSARIENSGIMDASLCHGTAGLAQISMRFHQWTSDEGFYHAAHRWLLHTMDAHVGEGRYDSWLVDDSSDGRFVNDEGFMTGSVGVALALLSAVSSKPPCWDGILLLGSAAEAQRV